MYFVRYMWQICRADDMLENLGCKDYGCWGCFSELSTM